MNICYVTFRSVTYAQRGEECLKSRGIGCSLLRTPRSMEGGGCGYCLRVRERELGEVLGALSGIPYRKVFRMNPQGSPEEIYL